MNKIYLLMIAIFFCNLNVQAYTYQQSNYRYTDKPKELPFFVQSCMYGAMGGAVAGTAALAFSDRPSQSLGHIARGASIGLYIGAIYGAYRSFNFGGNSQKSFKNSYSIMPKVNQYGKVDGAVVQSPVWRF